MIREDLINPKKIQNLFGGKETQRPAQAGPDLSTIIREPIFKEQTCIKFKKNGETYWENFETKTLYVEAIGVNSLKVRTLRYISDGKSWFFEPYANTMEFPNQSDYLYTTCPKEEDRLSDEAAEKLLKGNN